MTTHTTGEDYGPASLDLPARVGLLLALALDYAVTRHLLDRAHRPLVEGIVTATGLVLAGLAVGVYLDHRTTAGPVVPLRRLLGAVVGALVGRPLTAAGRLRGLPGRRRTVPVAPPGTPALPAAHVVVLAVTDLPARPGSPGGSGDRPVLALTATADRPVHPLLTGEESR